MQNVVAMAFVATLGTWLLTALGAASVLFLRKKSMAIFNPLLGFAAGVMIAASFWSLLQPAIEQVEFMGAVASSSMVTAGFLSGALFIYLSDIAIARAWRRRGLADDLRARRSIMLVLSITMHNIPEGLAVGVAFGSLVARGYPPEGLAAAISLAIGIGLQNFPEGAAVSLPLRREGHSRGKSFFIGQASGAVEPIAGVLGAVLVGSVQSIMPFALAFAAGAMVLVAVHELIPESQSDRKIRPYAATIGIVLGFALMMLLDVMLG